MQASTQREPLQTGHFCKQADQSFGDVSTFVNHLVRVSDRVVILASLGRTSFSASSGMLLESAAFPFSVPMLRLVSPSRLSAISSRCRPAISYRSELSHAIRGSSLWMKLSGQYRVFDWVMLLMTRTIPLQSAMLFRRVLFTALGECYRRSGVSGAKGRTVPPSIGYSQLSVWCSVHRTSVSRRENFLSSSTSE